MTIFTIVVLEGVSAPCHEVIYVKECKIMQKEYYLVILVIPTFVKFAEKQNTKFGAIVSAFIIAF